MAINQIPQNEILKFLFIGLGVIIIIFFVFNLKRIIRGVKNYRKLGKEEFKRRLQEGFESITPLQLTKESLKGQLITVIGILIGVIVTPIIRIEGIWWWMEIILGGSFIVSLVSLIEVYQRYVILKKQDKIMRSLSEETRQIFQEKEKEKIEY